MSKFDPPQNPNPSTDYDKTLHNWLRPWDKLVTQIWYKSAVRERLAKYVKYKASPAEVTRQPILTHNGSNYAESRTDVPFWGTARRPTTFRGQIPQKPFKKGAWSDSPSQVWEK